MLWPLNLFAFSWFFSLYSNTFTDSPSQHRSGHCFYQLWQHCTQWGDMLQHPHNNAWRARNSAGQEIRQINYLKLNLTRLSKTPFGGQRKMSASSTPKIKITLTSPLSDFSDESHFRRHSVNWKLILMTCVDWSAVVLMSITGFPRCVKVIVLHGQAISSLETPFVWFSRILL